MDLEESKLIIEILKTGSIYYKTPSCGGYVFKEEGIFIQYIKEENKFRVKRFEHPIEGMYYHGFNSQMNITEQELIDYFTGKNMRDNTWWPLMESNNYTFDFLFKPNSDHDRQLSLIDASHQQYLKCKYCNKKDVKLLSYSKNFSEGRAIMYVAIKVLCNLCGRYSEYEWDE